MHPPTHPGVDDDGIRVSGVALLDGTPVLDVKPFVPFSDNRSEASAPSWRECSPAGCPQLLLLPLLSRLRCTVV